MPSSMATEDLCETAPSPDSDQAFQQREGVLCFVFSRLRVVDEESERGKRRLNSLSFEDFLEAVVRVATMKVSTR